MKKTKTEKLLNMHKNYGENDDVEEARTGAINQMTITSNK